MQPTDNTTSFYSVEGEHVATIKIRRSTFICSLAYAGSISEAKDFISRVSRENKKATHNCWAYILGDQGEISHCSDAGEPPGTAGKPMLNMLKKYQMTWAAVVVTRYFGGVKLGVKGLIDAYGVSVQAVLDGTRLKKVVKSISFSIEVPYDFNDILMSRIKKYLVRICDTQYSEKVVHHLEIDLSYEKEMLLIMEECQNMGKLQFSILE